MYFERYEEGYPPDGLLAFQGWLQKQIDKVPPEYREEAQIEFGRKMVYDCAYETIEISYCRPMTGAEIAGDIVRKEKRTTDERARLLAQLAMLDKV